MYQIILNKTENGKSIDLNNSQLEHFLSKIKTKKILVRLEEYGDSPTPRQRGYYFGGIVAAFAEEKGMHVDAVHEYLKLTCNPVQYVNPKTSEISIVAGSTERLNKYEMAKYIDRCIMEMAMQDFIVLTPDEYFESIKPQQRSIQ